MKKVIVMSTMCFLASLVAAQDMKSHTNILLLLPLAAKNPVVLLDEANQRIQNMVYPQDGNDVESAKAISKVLAPVAEAHLFRNLVLKRWDGLDNQQLEKIEMSEKQVQVQGFLLARAVLTSQDGEFRMLDLIEQFGEEMDPKEVKMFMKFREVISADEAAIRQELEVQDPEVSELVQDEIRKVSPMAKMSARKTKVLGPHEVNLKFQ